jgi:hypothetical protein
MDDDKILGIDTKTFFIVLSIGGGLLIAWATAQISDIPPDFLTPGDFVEQNHRWIAFYRVLQATGALAAIIGGVQTYKNFGSK